MGTPLVTPSTTSSGSHSSSGSFAKPSAGIFTSPLKQKIVLSLALALATLLSYNSVSRNGYINLDDNGYLLDNVHIHGGLNLATVKWALTTFECENWHPLTWMSHALDWQLFGKKAAGHHYMSLLFHTINGVLLFLLLESATGYLWRSLMVAALFALHPVNVESVAWVAERKNVLSMMFFLLALMAYGWYAKGPSIRRYATVFLLFVLALMAKPQVITFPCVLLLWDYWPLRRFGSRETSEGETSFATARPGWLLLEKLPLFALSAADAVLTMLAQHKAVHNAMTQYPFPARVGNAVIAYARYVGHAFWPIGLSPAYAHLGDSISWLHAAMAAGFLVLVTILAVASKKRYLLVGWLWFLGILVPMIGIIQVGDQAMADRYAYIPFIGLFWILVWTVAESAQEWRVSPRWLAAPALLAIAGIAMLTARQVTYWHDSEALWRYALSVTDHNFLAHDYLAGILTLENRHEEAIQEYATAEELHPYPLTQVVYFADYELRHNHVRDSIVYAQRVIAGTNDTSAREMALRDLGIAKTQLGQPAEARDYYEQAMKLDPRDPYPLMGMGLLAYRESNFEEAANYFSRTVALDPSDFDYLLLGEALKKEGREAAADAAFASARQVSKDWTQAQDKANWFLTH